MTTPDAFDQVGNAPIGESAYAFYVGLAPDSPSSTYRVLDLVGNYEHGAFVPDRLHDED